MCFRTLGPLNLRTFKSLKDLGLGAEACDALPLIIRRANDKLLIYLFEGVVLKLMIMKNIVVNVYDPNWKKEFGKAHKFYSQLLSGVDATIEHVGSTSVEGLWAKPILDIDIIVKDDIMSKMVIELLKGAEYKHVGNLGLEGREAFRYKEDNPNITWMSHNLYVCIDGCENLINHILFRNHLRKNVESVKEYSCIKKDLAKKYPNDIDRYLDGKTDFITKILQQEGMDSSELKRIEAINKY